MDTEQYIKRLERKLDQALKNTRKETWVGATVITELTGWDHQKMRRMRDQGVIKFKKLQDHKLIYLLESLPEVFIRPKNESIA